MAAVPHPVVIDERTQEFGGVRYRSYQGGYYRTINEKKIRLLHVAVWEFFNGKIPEGYELHHRDGDKTNNAIENLQCLTKAEHTRLHQLERPLVKHICKQCGKEFYSRSLSVWLCSKRCQRAAWVDAHQEERTCVICGKKFSTYYERNSKTCSPSCRSKLTWQTRGKSVPDDVRAEIRRIYRRHDKELGEAALARKFGVTPETIRYILRENPESYTPLKTCTHISDEIKAEIKRRHKKGSHSCGCRALAREFNCCPSTIAKIINES